ncbi:MAG TPA: zf-HC2 domain-containing protein [Pyrinomonadaceae bacterium]|jgi:hypothetical protein
MKCDWTQKVSLLIDGELPPTEAHETASHLDLCRDCQSAREDFLLLRRELAAYPLALDPFARQRALKRILTAADGSNGGTALDHVTTQPTPRRRQRSASAFGLPRLSPAGLAALLLLLVGVAFGLVSLLGSRRAPTEFALHAPTPAPAHADHQASPAATPSLSPSPVDDLTASAYKSGDGAKLNKRVRERAATDSARATNRNAAGAERALSAANARRVERAGARVSGRSLPPAHLDRPRADAPVAETARNDAGVVEGGADDNASAGRDDEAAEASGAARGSKTARHVEQAQLLLRAFRNARPAEAGRRASFDLAHEKQRSKKLLYENIVLRREAASRGNQPVESLLDSLEPILLDIANLPDHPAPADMREINERMRRKNLVAMLQISAVESASARSY